MAKKNRQAVYLFGETAKNLTPQVRGGKGAGLAEMAALGLPVPPGFTLITSVARAFTETTRLPQRVAFHLNRGLRALERQNGKRLGDAKNPLLVSVRSGAAVSMPGMMDTVLNLGLNPATKAGLAEASGARFAADTYRRFLAQFGQTVLGVPGGRFEEELNTAKQVEGVSEDRELSCETLEKLCDEYRQLIENHTGRPVPDDPMEQLASAIFAVLASWGSERAVAYRNANNVPHWWGTAVNVQAMVFGNYGPTSGTGVVFSRNVATGDPGLYGEFLPEAQGEDVVAGIRTPLQIVEMQSWNGAVYQELEGHVRMLEHHYGDIVDVEFTVERGRLYILQSRRAKRTAMAAAVYAVHRVWEKSLTRDDALKLVTSEQAEQLRRPVFDPKAVAGATVIVHGMAASLGAAVGKVAFTSAKAQELAAAGEKAVLVRRDTSPEDLPGMLASVAIVTETGGATSHAAVVARGMGLPAVVGIGSPLDVVEGETVSVDGTSGTVYSGKLPLIGGSMRKEVRIFLRWLDGGITAWPQPRADFAWTEEKVCVNTVLNDFYLTDAMAREAVGTRLACDAENLKREVHIKAAEMLTCYLAIAVAGELRHSSDKAGLNAQHQKILKVLSKEFSLKQGGERHDVQMTTVAMLSKKQTRMLQFFQAAVEIFLADWCSSHGGKAWARIAGAPAEFLGGRMSHTVYVDHVFDLRHNGGRLFDKHPMCTAHTNDSSIVDQLEIKKLAKSIGELYQKLGCWYSFSPEVQEMWDKGKTKGLW